jgi:hypothetical protein
VTGKFGPVPVRWWTGGVPAEAVAALAEGFCPVHRTLLEPGEIRVGSSEPGAVIPAQRLPAGWCEACRCWWHDGPDPLVPAGTLVATWYPGRGKAAAAGDPGASPA